eukprot:COSAG01_NODE_158_length_23708_cov_7.921979_16_plen_166_part_00
MATCPAELHLPFVRHCFRGRDIQLVPIMVGSLTHELEASYGQLLAPYLDQPDNFFVVSSCVMMQGVGQGRGAGAGAGRRQRAPGRPAGWRLSSSWMGGDSQQRVWCGVRQAALSTVPCVVGCFQGFLPLGPALRLRALRQAGWECLAIHRGAGQGGDVHHRAPGR